MIITTLDAPKSPPSYSQAVKAVGLVFASRTAPVHPETGQIVEGTVDAQVAQCLRNISAILEAAGSSLQKAVSATLILADEEDFAAANEECMKWFPTDPPARKVKAAGPRPGFENLDRDDRRGLNPNRAPETSQKQHPVRRTSVDLG